MTMIQYVIILRPIETIMKERAISFTPSLHDFHIDDANNEDDEDSESEIVNSENNNNNKGKQQSLNYDYFHDWLKRNE